MRVLSLLVLFLASPLLAGDLRVGAYTQNINPPKLPISVNGGMADRIIGKIDDDLHARCFVLDDGKAKLALVVVDSCMIPREIHETAKELASGKTGIPKANILVSATHTHSAPTVAAVFQSLPDKDYAAFLTQKIAEGIEKANTRLAPAEWAFGVAREPDQVFNRRWRMEPGTVPAGPFEPSADLVKMNPGYNAKGMKEPAGPTDPDISFLAFRGLDGKPLALFANYSLHYVGGNPNLSADYFGAFCGIIQQKLGANKDFVAGLSNGTSGDVNNVNYAGMPVKRQQGEQIRIVADAVAGKVAKKYAGLKFQKEIALKSAEKDIELGVRKPDAKEIEGAKRLVAEATEKSKGLQGLPAIYAGETLSMAAYPDTVTAKIQAHRIGDLAICGIPCEVFTQIGLDIKKQSPLKKTFTVSLANGYNGYLPTPEQHALGGYETWRAKSSYLEVKASEKIMATMMGLLEGIAR